MTKPQSALSSSLEYTQSILRLEEWDRDADSDETMKNQGKRRVILRKDCRNALISISKV